MTENEKVRCPLKRPKYVLLVQSVNFISIIVENKSLTKYVEERLAIIHDYDNAGVAEDLGGATLLESDVYVIKQRI